MAQREAKANHYTSTQIDAIPETAKLYRGIGKAFLLTDRQGIKENLEKEQENHTKNLRDLMDRQEYLERRISSASMNLRELLQGV